MAVEATKAAGAASGDWLSADIRGFLAPGTSLVVAAASPVGVPDLAFALACLVDDARQRLGVVLAREPARPLLQLLEDGQRRVALVASRTSDLRTLQFKGRDAQVQPFDAAARPDMLRQVEGFRRALMSLGFSAAYCAALQHHRPDDLVRISFHPEQCYEQTPGPRAGRPMPLAG